MIESKKGSWSTEEQKILIKEAERERNNILRDRRKVFWLIIRRGTI